MRHEQTLRDDSYSTKESFTKKKDLKLIWGNGARENILYQNNKFLLKFRANSKFERIIQEILR